MREGAQDVAFQQVNLTRAMLCELLAIKLVRTFSADGLELVTVLTAPFSPFVGIELSPAYREQEARREASGDGQSEFVSVSGFQLSGEKDATHASCSALEMALLSSSKKFVKSPLCQKVVQGIWDGTVVIANASQHAILSDDYKRKPLSIYDPRTAPLLDHYRLKVPQIRSRLEFVNFIFLLAFFILCLGQKESSTWSVWETVFTIWLGGFALDEIAQVQEHGWSVYFASVWNFIDSLFIAISTIWLVMRIVGLRSGDEILMAMSFDVLALGAVLLCPRVASALIRDNVVLLALRAMISDFAL